MLRYDMRYNFLLLLVTAIISVQPAVVNAAATTFELGITELDKEKPKKRTSTGTKPRNESPSAPRKISKLKSTGNHVIYVVKKGDHIYRILVKEFGFSDKEAEAIIPEVSRLNSITDIRKLSVSQNLLIPLKSTPKKAEAVPSISKADITQIQSNETPASPTASPTAGRQLEIRFISEKSVPETIDSLLESLHLTAEKGHVLTVPAKGDSVMFSIKVDRFFEYKGKRFIISLVEADPYNYTLLRILENTGYHRLQVSPSDDYVKTTSALLNLVGISAKYGLHELRGDDRKTLVGFLISDKDLGENDILITSGRNVSSPPIK
jgi:hypothetical protein